MRFEIPFMSISLILASAFVAFNWGVIVERNKNRIELKALQAQVDKKYCKGEVIYSGPKEKFLGR